MDTGLLILRIVVGGLMVAHGGQKLFGWHRGYGLRGTGNYLETLGYRPGFAFALIAGLSEAGSGALLGLGLGMPFVGALLIATMINVYSGHEGKGIWNHEGGWEFPLILGTIGATLAFTGGGRYALDSSFGWSLSGVNWGLAAVVTGLAAGLSCQLSRRRNVVQAHA